MSAARPFRSVIASIVVMCIAAMSLVATGTSTAQTRRERREAAQER